MLSCLNAALRKDLGKWSPIKEGKSFSALTLLEDLTEKQTVTKFRMFFTGSFTS